MSNDFDERLRKALRPVDPGEPFTQSVLARVAKEPARSTSWVTRPTLRWISAGLAASLLLGVLVAHDWHARRTEEGLEARRQLLEALRVTSNKLDIAYRAVNDGESAAKAGPDS
jgi:hypothetical protein